METICCREGSKLSKDISALSCQLKMLADQNRLRIICLLSKAECCVCVLEKELNLPQNLVSHHLSVLKKGSWVESRKEGKWAYYRLNKKVAMKFIKTFEAILKFYKER